MQSSLPLDIARSKAFFRLMPVLFICYVIAYVDRTNVAIAKLTMSKDMPAFDNAVIGFGAGIFFIGYFLLEIPGSLIVERWSARKWICRIMVTWGILAAATAFVTTPMQFYVVRFFLGLAEAGFFPGVIVYLTHWFLARDRAKAISIFLVASPIAMIVGPLVSRMVIHIGTTEIVQGIEVVYPAVLGLKGWQWIYVMWGLPAVVIGISVLFLLPDHPRHARWLKPEERKMLEEELESERALKAKRGHMKVWQALTNFKIVLLAVAYFGIVTANYGVEFFLPSILEKWYSMKLSEITLLVILPSFIVVAGQLFIGWSSDRWNERRWHSAIPVILGATALAITPWTNIFAPGAYYASWLTVFFFMLAAGGLKSYMPAFWSLPSMMLTQAAAAGSVGLINSVGNLGGFLGPYVLGYVEKTTNSFSIGIYFLATTSAISALIIALMPLAARPNPEKHD